MAGRGRGHGRGRGGGHSGLSVAAISVTDVQNMVDTLSGSDSAFFPNEQLIDSEADINICLNYEMFSYMGPCEITQCTPIDSTPLHVHGKGVVRMCVGQYVDKDGLHHPIDLEIKDVSWVPWSPMNVLATPSLVEQIICLFTGRRGN